MANKLSLIEDAFKFFLKSRYWLWIAVVLIVATLLSFLFIYKADESSETNLVNAITIITTVLAIALLFSDFHRNWRESREKRLSTLFYQKDKQGQLAVMFYYRATLGGESDIRSLSQQLGVEIIELGIGKNQGYVNTRLNLSVASNQYHQISKILQDENGKTVQDHIAISALYEWTATTCKDIDNPKAEKTKKDNLVKIQATMQKAIENQQIYFAKGDSDESEWGFATWEEIAKEIAPEIKQKIEVYGKENNLVQFK